MNRPRKNKRDHQSDSRKNVFLSGVKIEKAILYVKAILSRHHNCLRISAGFIFFMTPYFLP
jgi:hypothetical protein